MATHSDSPPPASDTAPKRIKPHQVVIAMGCFIGLFTLVSGILPQITDWHDDNTPSREVFGGNSRAHCRCVLHGDPRALVWGAIAFRRSRPQLGTRWARSATHTPKNVARRFADFRPVCTWRTLLRDPAAGAMHSMIYFGILPCTVSPPLLEVRPADAAGAKFLHGTTYLPTHCFVDAAGSDFHVVHRPWRSSGVMCNGHIASASRPSPSTQPSSAPFCDGASAYSQSVGASPRIDPAFLREVSFIGYPLSTLFDGMSIDNLDRWHQIMWSLHVVGFVVFLALLPITMLRHMFTSPLNMYLRDRDRPKGAMKAMPNLAEDIARDVRCFGGRGLHVEAVCWIPMRAPCAVAAPASARRTPPASRSTLARSSSRSAR
jgi:hypothetical protein